jgi:hypothetical protein
MSIKRVARGYKAMLGDNPAMSVHETVCRQCAKLLQRLHQTVPFPARALDVAMALLPENVACNKDDSPRASNMRLSMMWGNVLHVAIETREEWQKMLKGELPFNRVFWMQLPGEVPVPDAITHPYRLFEEHPYYDALVEWHREATDLNARIESAVEQIGSVVKYTENAAMLRHVWPELMSFVKLQGPTVMHIPTKLIRNTRYEARDVLDDAERGPKIIELLTAATLLDEAAIDAWVSFKTL